MRNDKTTTISDVDEKINLGMAFIGEKAINRYNSVDVNESFQKAVRMESTNNYSPLQIKIATGFERGADMLWRYETPDFAKSDDEINKIPAGNYLLKTIIKPKYIDILEKMYPTLLKIPLVLDNSIKNGNYGSIRVRGGFVQPEYKVALMRIRCLGTDQVSETANHELQHIIQILEGFESGTNSSRKTYKNYLRNAGEWEARIVEARKSLSIGERRYSLMNKYSDTSSTNYGISKNNLLYHDVPKSRQKEILKVIKDNQKYFLEVQKKAQNLIVKLKKIREEKPKETANNGNQETYISEVSKRFLAGDELNRNTLYKIADKNNVPHESDKDKRIMLQLTEFALVEAYRTVARDANSTPHLRYEKIVKLYEKQPNISLVTNITKQFQQYSTAAPIAYLMGYYVKANYTPAKYFEPSAGNGMLTMYFIPQDVDVNEFEETRYNNLCNYTKYHEVMNLDGTKCFDRPTMYDGIITNPPFGSIDTKENTAKAYIKVDGYELRKKEFLMTYRTLECMKDNGRAAIIIGGDLQNDYYDEWGFYKKPADKLFFNYLYKHYNVERVFNIDGELYRKQGTTYNIRLILINGRKTVPTPQKPTVYKDVIHTFDELWQKVAVDDYSQALDGVGSTFRQQLKQFFAGTFKGWFISVTTPKKFLLDCGIPNLPIAIRPNTLSEKIRKHTLTKDMIKNLDSALNSPLLVYKSLTYTGAFNIIIEKQNHEGLLCVSIHLNVEISKFEINEIASIHGRRIDQLINWAESNALISGNSEKLKKVLIGSQFNSAKSEYLFSLLDTAKVQQISESANKSAENLSGLYKNHRVYYQMFDDNFNWLVEGNENPANIPDNTHYKTAIKMATEWCKQNGVDYCELQSNRLDYATGTDDIMNTHYIDLRGIDGTATDQTSIDFNKKIMMYKRGISNKRHYIFVCQTPNFWLKKGFQTANIYLPVSVIDKAIKNKHDLTIEHFINFPDELRKENNLYWSKTEKDSFVQLTNLKDLKGHSVVLALHMKFDAIGIIKIYKIASVYGKFSRQLKKWEDGGLKIE